VERHAAVKQFWTIPQPGKLVSINEVAGKSWQSVQGHKRWWMQGGWAHGLTIAQELNWGGITTPLHEPATIQFEYSVPVHRHRDGHNYAGTITKWFIDGMVIAKVFRDDSVEHLTVRDATFKVEKLPVHHGREMTVTLEYTQ
jgi:hypothetical protein